MTLQLELLNAADHALLSLRAAPERAPHFVQIVAAEFAAAAATCPIFITKDAATGKFYVGAMFGFNPGENLLLDDSGGNDAFQPLDIERQGFYVSGESIAIDPGHPRFNDPAGEPLFASDGQPGEKLRHIQRVLGQLHAGIEQTDAFIGVLTKHRLIEPVDITLRFDDGETLSLAGLYTVSLDALNDLDDATLVALFRQGYLQLAYTMAGSLHQIPVLSRRRNRRLAARA